MADIEFVEGEYGDTYTITIKDEDGNDANISGYTSAFLVINSKDLQTNKLNASCTISTPTIVWTMTDGQTNYDGSFVAQIQLSAGAAEKTTKLLSVTAHKKLAT
jgi:hypothetical protein